MQAKTVKMIKMIKMQDDNIGEIPIDDCKPAAYVLGVAYTDCDSCPFPFCVRSEANIIQMELREHLVRIMRKLGKTMKEAAEAAQVTPRSAYRYMNVDRDTDCAFCNKIHSQDVMCKSDVYSVVYENGQPVVILNKHRGASPLESKIVETFTSYVFPNSSMERGIGIHDYWKVGKVELDDAKNFERMCDALNMYTMSLNLNRSTVCLQQVR